MARTRKKAAYIAAESSYGSDPSSNGSGYAWIPALSLPEIPMGKELLETNYFTGRPYKTTPQLGREGGTFDMSIPIIGLADFATDGESPSATADDWFDNILESIFGDSPTEPTGETVNSSSASTVTFDAVATDVVEQDLIAVRSSSILSTQSQVRLLSDGTSDPTWTVVPNFATSPSASVAYAVREYIQTETNTGGSSQSIVITDGGGIVGSSFDSDIVGAYVFTGCRPTAFSITAEAGQRYTASLSIGFHDITEDSTNKTSLPEAGTAPATTPLVAILGAAYFNGTAYPTRRVEIDFGIQAAQIDATGSAEGRSGWDILEMHPVIRIEPLATDAIRELLRSGPTTGRLLVQLGAGWVGSGVCNGCVFHAELASPRAVERTDDNGRARQMVEFHVEDPGEWTSGTLGRVFQFGRF